MWGESLAPFGIRPREEDAMLGILAPLHDLQ